VASRDTEFKKLTESNFHDHYRASTRPHSVDLPIPANANGAGHPLSTEADLRHRYHPSDFVR
jgi:hypothetical protein